MLVLTKTDFHKTLLENLIKYEGSEHYAKIIRAIITATNNSYTNGNASKAQKITDCIMKAVAEKRPKRRYTIYPY